MPIDNLELHRIQSRNAPPPPGPAVRLAGLGTAVPPFSVSQSDLLEFVLSRFTIQENTKALYQKTFADPSIAKRHFALENLNEALDTDRNRMRARFEERAVQLSESSLKSALAAAKLAPRSIDYLIATTCTGYLCPGISSYLVERCGLRADVRLVDAVGMGCGAALPALEQATHFARSNAGAVAAVVSTEICSAAFFSNDAPDIVISNTLFADGSAAAIVDSREEEETVSSSPALHSFASITVPEWRDTLRFRHENGYLRNVLSKEVPGQAARAIRHVVHVVLTQAGLSPHEVTHWIMHSGGKKILDSIEMALHLSPAALSSSRTVLRDFGNMSSPSAFFAWEEEHRSKPPDEGEWGILCSFGAGFSAHAALIRY